MKNNERLYPKLFECCRIVRGQSRSLICDIQRESYRVIPNEIADLLEKHSGKNLYQIKKAYENKFDVQIDENFKFLEREEFVFFTDHPEWFPKMKLEWNSSSRITNAIIDRNMTSDFSFDVIFRSLSELGCEYIQLRFFDFIDLLRLKRIVENIGRLRIISLEIVLPYSNGVCVDEWIKFVKNEARISYILFFNADEYKCLYKSNTNMGHVYAVAFNVHDNTHCGNFGKNQFVLNIQSFTEAINYNSCLNRKISIDSEGNIKNCPSMTESYGNIRDTTLAEAIEKPGFKKYWNINKDQIAVCKDCEFRYICTDCRAYVEDPHDTSGLDGTNLSKPLKCGYDPYTGEWAEWSTNPLKQKAIEFYGMQDLVKSNEVSPE